MYMYMSETPKHICICVYNCLVSRGQGDGRSAAAACGSRSHGLWAPGPKAREGINSKTMELMYIYI